MHRFRQYCFLFACTTLLCAAVLKAATPAFAYRQADNVSYLSAEALATADAYRKAQCRLDIKVPEGETGFPTVIWLHGGGLTAGERYFPALEDEGWGLVAVSYRLAPQADLPAFIEDAAAATAWVLRTIEAYGGDPEKVFIAGHSAGGYLAAMVAMDPQWLAAQGASNQDLAGAIPVSAQVTTHFQVKKLQGDTGHPLRPLIDAYAPLYHADRGLPPICLITGDRAIEWESRVEENLLLEATLRNMGHPHVEMHELPGKDHGTVVGASWRPMAQFIKTVLARQGDRQQEAARQGGEQQEIDRARATDSKKPPARVGRR